MKRAFWRTTKGRVWPIGRNPKKREKEYSGVSRRFVLCSAREGVIAFSRLEYSSLKQESGKM